MVKYLPSSIKVAVTLAAAAFTLASCEVDSGEALPETAPTISSFSLVDSLKVNAYFEPSQPELYQAFQSKTYQVKNENQLDIFFYEENNGLTLFFKDISSPKERSWVTIHFKNRTVQNLPAAVSLKDTAVVCLQNGQSFKDGTAALSAHCLNVLDGTMTLNYNVASQTLHGSVQNLKFGLEYYVPEYAFPNRNGNVFKASGSSRNLNLSFESVKGKKM